MPELWFTWQQALCLLALVTGAFLMGMAHGAYRVEARIRRLTRRYTHRCFCGWKSDPCRTVEEAKAQVHAHIADDDNHGKVYRSEVRP